MQVPRLYLAWPSAGDDNDDAYALQFLGQILAGPRTARLTKALVFDHQTAATVSAFNDGAENAGTFIVIITPRPGHSLGELEAATDSVIARLKQDGPTQEEMAKHVGRARVRLRVGAAVESRQGRHPQRWSRVSWRSGAVQDGLRTGSGP